MSFSNRINEIIEETVIFDSDIVRTFYEILYEFSITREWSEETSYFIDYKTMISEDITKRKENTSVIYQTGQSVVGQAGNLNKGCEFNELEIAS